MYICRNGKYFPRVKRFRSENGAKFWSRMGGILKILNSKEFPENYYQIFETFQFYKIF